MLLRTVDLIEHWFAVRVLCEYFNNERKQRLLLLAKFISKRIEVQYLPIHILSGDDCQHPVVFIEIDWQKQMLERILLMKHYELTFQ